MTISGADSTLQQSRDRLAQLSAALEQWASGQKAPLRHQQDVEAGAHEWRIEAPATVPDELAHGAGEVLLGLRGVLDEAVRGAADRAGVPVDHLDAIRFPITTSILAFDQVAEQQLAGAPAPLRAALEAYQPYQMPPAPVSANLGILARLSALAEQSALTGEVVIAAAVDPRSIEVTAGKEGANASVIAGYGVGKPANGELALRIEVEPADTPIQVQPFNPPSLVIAFGDEHGRVAIPDLQNLLDTVTRVQGELAQHAATPTTPELTPPPSA